jgi:hypothetical protein
MRKIRRLLLLTCLLFFVLMPIGLARSQPPEGEQEVLVGRISYVEGKLLRYVPEEKDWVVTVKDAPFGMNDALYSYGDTKAEFIMPNNTLVRTGGDTQVQLIALESGVTEVDVASGKARFYNKSADGVIKATTPFGYVVAPAEAIFDLYVGDESLEVIGVRGKVDFILDSDQTRYEVIAGSSSIIADQTRVSSGEGVVDADWDIWNTDRENLWAQRRQVRGDSVKYLPPALHDEAYDLDENGRWEQVYYEGGYRNFWRPAHVSAGWEPYSVGRWTVYYGDNCWVPDEPFGYVTHHHGNWVYVGNFWYWAPPVVAVGVGVGPLVGIGFGWYPGRVGWIHSGVDVGWFPLAPHEPYYSHHNWGRHATVINNININNINININKYKYFNKVTVINQNNLYRVNDYSRVRITNINRTTITNNYKAAPVLDNRVIKNYSGMKQRYNFTNAVADIKPHNEVLRRIEANQKISRRDRTVSAGAIERDVSRFKQGRPVQEAQIQRPRVTDKLVRPDEVNKPRSEIKFQQKDLIRKAKRVQESPASRVQGPEGRPAKVGREAQPLGSGQPPAEGRKIIPPKPGREVQPGQPGELRTPREKGQRVVPLKPGREVKPAEPGQLRQPAAEGRKIIPPKPGREVQPAEPSKPKRPGEDRRVSKPTPEQIQPGGVAQPQRSKRQLQEPRPQVPKQKVQKKPKEVPPQGLGQPAPQQQENVQKGR